MNALREVYDFITGGSVVAPVGLAIAIGAVLLSRGIPSNIADGIFVAVLVLTLALVLREKVT